MKFSISFKYSNVTFKNKETKETISYDTKAEGNTFTFDNVDEDVVLGIVKGIKDRKASQVFSYDDFRTNFINVMARNKCKELYDKLDKGDWKIGDIAISNITIKDLEFTKPTMNARETITVESKKIVKEGYYGKCIGCGKEGYGDHTMTVSMLPICRDCGKKVDDFEKTCKENNFIDDQAAFIDFLQDEENKRTAVLFYRASAVGPHDLYYPPKELLEMSPEKLARLITRILARWWHVPIKNKEDKNMNESKEKVEIEFKKTPDDGTVIAFFPQTMHDGSCNPGNIMSYEHNGQHGEASIDYYKDCTTCLEEDYASLLHELEGIYDDCELVVV